MKKVTFYKLGIESKLWHAFKVKCAQLNITMLSAIESLIKKFVANNDNPYLLSGDELKKTEDAAKRK